MVTIKHALIAVQLFGAGVFAIISLAIMTHNTIEALVGAFTTGALIAGGIIDLSKMDRKA